MIGYLLFILFVILVAKSILETIWGVCLLLCGLGWHIIGMILDVLIFGERLIKKMRKISVFCLLGTCAITSIGHAQTNNEPTVQPSLVGYVGPVNRTLTSNDGRTIDVVITAKTESAIKARKADGTKFEIALDKLSEADKTFVAGLVVSPIQKMRVLMIGWDLYLSKRIKATEFEVTVADSVEALKKLTDQELESFDAIMVTREGCSRWWSTPVDKAPIQEGTEIYIQRDRILKLMGSGKVVAWKAIHKIQRSEFIENKQEPERFTPGEERVHEAPFVDVQNNTIFFSWNSRIWSRQRGKKKEQNEPFTYHSEFVDQTMGELKKVINKTR